MFMVWKKRCWPVAMLLGAIMALSACASYSLTLTYSADPIDARVIDAETKQPLEGVVVTANWQLEYGTYGGDVPAGQLMVMEAVTDKDGRFHFSGWGPKLAIRSHLSPDLDPQIILFKSGYDYRALTNSIDFNKGARRRSDWNGKTIEMKKFTGTRKEWFEMLERVIPPFGEPKDAQKVSTLLEAILAEEDSIPDSIERKRVFFDDIVRRLLNGDKH
jgi:hypothetical protein